MSGQKINFLVRVKWKMISVSVSKRKLGSRVYRSVRPQFIVAPLVVDELDGHGQGVSARHGVADGHQENILVAERLWTPTPRRLR